MSTPTPGGPATPTPTPRPSADLPTQMATPRPSADMPTQVAAPSPGGATMMTKAVLDLTQATQSAGTGSARATLITQLHIETSAGHSATGTHKGEQWGDFTIGDLLGRGGMGAVYKGIQVSLDRPVAIKVLPQHLSQNANFRDRFHLEAKSVARLSSPNVIQVYAAGVHEGNNYFAMEFVEGEDLARRLSNGFRPSYQESLGFVTQAARGLAAAGELGIVHRDIKPANMMVTTKGVLKIMDFGLVKLASEEHSLTLSGTVMGTVSYFSPEQGRGDRCDHRTDIYALGVVFYELLTGRLPFAGADATSIIYQHIHSAPKLPKEIDPAIPEGYQAVVLKCMQKKAEDRYADANSLLSDLIKLAQGEAPSQALANPAQLRSGATVIKSPPFALERSRRPLIWLAAAVLALGATVITWQMTHHHESPPSQPAAVDVRTPRAPDQAPVPVTTQPQATLPSGPTPAMVLGLIQAGKLEEARRLTDAALEQDPKDPDWLTTSASVNQARGTALLATIRQALDRGDLTSADAAAAAARQIIPQSSDLTQLSGRIAEIARARKERLSAIDSAENLLSAGDWASALPVLEKLDAEQPGQQAVAALLARARAAKSTSESISAAVSEQLTNADRAMSQKDYDAALLSYTAVKQLDPKNVAASQGLDHISQLKSMIASVRTAFDAALRAGDQDKAEAQLAKMREIAPGSPTLAVAENQLATARLSSERSRHEAEAQDAKLAAQARSLLARLEDPAQPLPDLERETAALASAFDPGRPERAQLQNRLEDRKSHDEVASTLTALDAAVRGGHREVITQIVTDPDFASSLSDLSKYDGLAYSSAMTEFQRHEQDAATTVAIRTALKLSPERTLNYHLDFHRAQDRSWRIIAAHQQP